MGVIISDRSTNSLQVEINGLGKPANEYYNFRAQIFTYSGAFAGEINWTSSGTGNLTRNTFYGLTSKSTYTIRAYVQSLASSSEIYWGEASGTTLAEQPPPDTTPPTITYQGATGIGLLRLEFTASDSGSGLSYFATYVGSANGDINTLQSKHYLSASDTYAEWTTDGYGNNLVVGAWYWVRVRAYDNNNNSSVLDYRIQFKRIRPNDWTWSVTMTSGQPVNITANEWNNFTTRINQFRFYMGLSNYTFTSVSSGYDIFAYQVNEAVNAINPMVTNPLSTQVSGGTAAASFMNLLRDRLNSIQ